HSQVHTPNVPSHMRWQNSRLAQRCPRTIFAAPRHGKVDADRYREGWRASNDREIGQKQNKARNRGPRGGCLKTVKSRLSKSQISFEAPRVHPAARCAYARLHTSVIP